MNTNFVPSPDVAAILHALLDTYERRRLSPLPEAEALGMRGDSPPPSGEGRGVRAIRLRLDSLPIPGYHSQSDPVPRQTANEQLLSLEALGWVKLAWLPGETGHLLASVTLVPDRAESVFRLLNRTPLASHRGRLRELLLAERFRFDDWRRRAVQHALGQLRAEKSPVPFSLADDEFNRDLLTALAALDGVRVETLQRVFSVRVFNDSKRFEALMGAMATLARRARPEWRGLSNEDVLRELNLVANPGHLYLHGPWRLVDDSGQIISLGEFHPSVGLPASQAARVRRVTVEAGRVICVENPTAFYELIRAHDKPPDGSEPSAGLAALCLWGNPSPACRHLLRCLPGDLPLLVWADIDYGGLNILAQLREQVYPSASPHRMDIETLDAHAQWASPLTPRDRANLARLSRRASLTDVQPLIAHMLRRGLKMEQEAIALQAA